MGWIATKKQKIKRDGKYVEVQPGDPVPEAEQWPNQQAHVDMGYIRWLPRDTDSKAKSVKSVVTPKVEPPVDVVDTDKPKKRGRPKKKKSEEEAKTYFEKVTEE
jgi:hypothetical protein